MTFDPKTLPPSVQEAYRHGAGAWPVVVKKAIEAGIQDINKLTDIVFFLHHPDRNGRAISPSESKMIEEWKGFRSSIQPMIPVMNPQAPNPEIPVISQEGVDDFSFPLAFRPSYDWNGGKRYFGAPRSNGRKYAGCDLLGPMGTSIYAVSDGVLVRGPYQFTGPKQGLPVTDAVEIRHGSILIRYGEIMPGSYVGGKMWRRVR